MYGIEKIDGRKVAQDIHRWRGTTKHGEPANQKVNKGDEGRTWYTIRRPFKGIITYASSDGMEFESGRLKAEKGGGGQNTRKPWLGSRVVHLGPSPSLI